MIPKISQFVNNVKEGIQNTRLSMRDNKAYDRDRTQGQANAKFAREQHFRKINESLNGTSTRPTGKGAPTTPAYKRYVSDEGAKYGDGKPLLVNPNGSDWAKINNNKPPRV